MSSCHNTKILFSDYLDDFLSPTQKKAVDAHLAVCSECKISLQQVKYLTKRLHDVTNISASRNFDQSLRARIINKEPAASRTGAIRNITFGFSGVAVFAALTFFIMSTVNTPTIDSPQNTISNAPQKTHQQLFSPSTKTQSDLASETQKMDSLKNKPAQVDQKIQLVGQENK